MVSIEHAHTINNSQLTFFSKLSAIMRNALSPMLILSGFKPFLMLTKSSMTSFMAYFNLAYSDVVSSIHFHIKIILRTCSLVIMSWVHLQHSTGSFNILNNATQEAYPSNELYNFHKDGQWSIFRLQSSGALWEQVVHYQTKAAIKNHSY